MMGVAGILGGALLCAIHGATVENTLLKMASKQILSKHLSLLKKKRPILWLLLTVSGHRYSALPLAISVGFTSLCFLYPSWVFGLLLLASLVSLLTSVLTTSYHKKSEQQKIQSSKPSTPRTFLLE
jgi:hypothetical protein